MTKTEKKSSLVFVMIIYLAGIFMGAIDTGIVTPSRTIIQNDLNVDPTLGIWMITIYTLSYAASIPIMGKLADQFGRKYVYLISISLFGIGSLLCGLSQSFSSFNMLLISRAIQAIGGGGILPIATAEFGTTFPKEKQGMALGLVGGVYGVANIVGATVGSAILDIFGSNNWQFIFYVNVPITLFIVISGFFVLENGKANESEKIDVFGIVTLVLMILSFLYGLKNIDFFNFKATLTSLDVFPYLIITAVLIPIFIFIEKRAKDPVMNLKYFTNKNIILTLLISFISGIVMMGMIFVPQFSENALKIHTGSGGYMVMILGLFAGVCAPISGKLIDKYGVKIILAFGFLVSALGCIFLMFVTIKHPNFINVMICLILIGIGIGFTMGTPLNYMMLSNTKKKESNSALATLSLVRSIGTAIAPAIMVGFIAHAGTLVQSNVTDILPTQITLPKLPYSTEISKDVKKLKSNPNMKDHFKNVNIPDLNSMTTVKISMDENSDYKMPKDLIELMQTSDVTTITKNTKTMATSMFNQMTPDVIEDIQGGITKGTKGIDKGISQMNKTVSKMKSASNGIQSGINGIQKGINAQKNALSQLNNVKQMFSQMQGAPIPPGMTLADMIPNEVKSKMPKEALKQLSSIKSVSELDNKIKQLKSSISKLEKQVNTMKQQKSKINSGINEMEATIINMKDLKHKMNTLNKAIPESFNKALDLYLAQIDKKSSQIEKVFQDTLNEGFKNVYMTSLIASVLALLLLAFYSKKDELTQEEIDS